MTPTSMLIIHAHQNLTIGLTYRPQMRRLNPAKNIMLILTNRNQIQLNLSKLLNIRPIIILRNQMKKIYLKRGRFMIHQTIQK
ncbi:unnamed protein product [Hymenolepis diminuta]|uniref:Uncharacterized protein n=1 Tax=Hymenolepis diminuta TaxID=6216 RepID=A0A564Z2Q0_HYMDI|nr:unnamed protein product [Hymenolepis diminuta]